MPEQLGRAADGISPGQPLADRVNAPIGVGRFGVGFEEPVKVADDVAFDLGGLALGAAPFGVGLDSGDVAPSGRSAMVAGHC
jgi:hypothetical protein